MSGFGSHEFRRRKTLPTSRKVEVSEWIYTIGAHRNPVLHRDIKPSNLILGEDNYIYLIDFGAVQDKAAFAGSTFTIVGTYGYAPMEQFGGRAVAASDLYTLGANLIHLLTGVSPADLPQQDLQIQFGRISLDSNFVWWIAKLVQPYATKRFQTARQALDALRSLDRSTSTPTYPTSRPPESSLVSYGYPLPRACSLGIFSFSC